MKIQQIYEGDFYNNLLKILKENNTGKFILVAGNSFNRLDIKKELDRIDIPYILFDRFKPNPSYGEVMEGADIFLKENCDFIVGIGGGSAIDVAKNIKYYSEKDVKLLAVPTTAGSGSESTRFAVIYKDGEKQSINTEDIIPEYVILESSVLLSLPDYQKKSTWLDALCQAIESWWSVNSDAQSKMMAEKSIKLLINNLAAYLNKKDESSCKEIMSGSNEAGQAINITQTTAAHAMSYKLTSLYNMPHGQAVAVCLPYIWEYMTKITDSADESKCSDARGIEYLKNIFEDINNCIMCAVNKDEERTGNAIEWFKGLLAELDMLPEPVNSYEDIKLLASSVNKSRLANNPVLLDDETLEELYKKALNYK